VVRAAAVLSRAVERTKWMYGITRGD
jgi:hypothetical protein